MHPILLKLGPVTVYSYGVMIALGFAIATFFMYTRAKDFQLDRDRVIDLLILILITGILGARLLYILLNLPYYSANPLEIPNLSKGGLVWYGGFLSAIAATIFYVLKYRLNFWSIVDLMSPYIALAQCLGRIGCFLNGCCYGIEAGEECILGIVSADGHTLLYPTQIYSSVALLLIFIVLRIWQDRRHFPGEIFLGYCALYSSKRFLMEFLRGDNEKIILGLTLSQIISVAVFFLALGILFYKAVEWKRRDLSLK